MTTDWSDRGHEQWEELAVGHGLHSLEPEDEEAFVRHLRGCARCERMLVDIEAAAADLAYAVPPLEPPDRLRKRVAAIPGDEHRPVALSRRTPTSGRLRGALRQPSGRAWMAVAAGLVVVVALSVWNLVLHTDNAAHKKEINRAAAALECVEDPACQRVPLTDPQSEAAKGAVLVRGQRVDVVVDGLPPNDRQSTSYVLWQQVKGEQAMVAVSAFDVTCHGLCVVPMQKVLPRPWDTTTGFAISKEASRTPPPTPAAAVAIGGVPGSKV